MRTGIGCIVVALSTMGSVMDAGAADITLSAETGHLDYHMRETSDTGSLLNREDGTLPIQRVGARLSQSEKYMELSAWQSEHVIPYFGASQSGFPVFTSTQLKVQGWQFRTGYSWAWRESSAVALSLGLDNINIDRNILPSFGTLPLREVLDSTSAVIGASIQTKIDTHTAFPLTLSAEVDALPMLRNRLLVDSFGLYDPITLAPDRHTDWRSKLKLSLAPSASLRIWVSLQQQTLTPGSTPYQTWTQNGVPATLVRYPGSRQKLTQYLIGISWQL